MAANKDYLELVIEKLTPLGDVTGKSMFGGFGVFHGGRMFGLISKDVFYLKVGDANREEYSKRCCPQFKPMPYFQVPDDVFEDDEQLLLWAHSSIDLNR